MTDNSTEIPIKNLYMLLAYAWDCLPEAELVEVELDEVSDVANLCALVLTNGLDCILERGLAKEYNSYRETTARPRGSIDMLRSAFLISRGRSKMECEFTVLDDNTIPNRIIKSTLQMMSHDSSLDYTTLEPETTLGRRYKVHKQLGRLAKIDSIELKEHLPHIVEHGINSALYNFLLNICRLYYDNRLMQESKGIMLFSRFDSSNKAKLRILFESFVRNFYYREQDFFECVPGRSHINVVSRFGKIGNELETGISAKEYDPLPEMQVDALLQHAERTVIIECKFTRDGLRIEEGKKFKPRRRHVYQLDAYLHNYAACHKYVPKVEGILLYPTIGLDANHHAQYIPTNAENADQSQILRVCTINLDQEWRKIRSQLLKIISLPSVSQVAA